VPVLVNTLYNDGVPYMGTVCIRQTSRRQQVPCVRECTVCGRQAQRGLRQCRVGMAPPSAPVAYILLFLEARCCAIGLCIAVLVTIESLAIFKLRISRTNVVMLGYDLPLRVNFV
jgi:hypothetical protein